MKRIVVLFALAYIAFAAPTTPDLEEGKSERTFGGGDIGHHQHHLEPVVHTYGHGPYGHGLHGHQGIGLHHGHQELGLYQGHQGYNLFREQDEGAQKKSRELCAKEVEANCGARAGDADDASDKEAAAIEEQKLLRMIATAAEDLKARMNQNSVSSKETNDKDDGAFFSFLLKMLTFLAERLLTLRSNEAGWRHGNSKSDLALHENIKAAMRALEDIEAFEKSRNFKNHHHAAASDGEDFEDMPRAKLMARLSSVIDKLQRDVDVDNTKDAENQEDVQKKIKTQHNEMEMSASTSHIAIAETNSDNKTHDNKFRTTENLAMRDDHISQKIMKSSEFLVAKESDTKIQGKDAEVNTMSIKASEHDKDMSHKKKLIENASVAIPKNLKSGKAVDNTDIQKAQQNKMHHGSMMTEAIKAGIHQDPAAARQDDEHLAKNSVIEMKAAENIEIKNNEMISALVKSADVVSQQDFTKTLTIDHDAKLKKPEASQVNRQHRHKMDEARDTEFSQSKNSEVFEKHNNPIVKSDLKEDQSKHTMKSADEVSVYGPSVAVSAGSHGGGAVAAASSYGGAASSAGGYSGGASSAGGYGGVASTAGGYSGAAFGAGGHGGAASSAGGYSGAAPSAGSLGGNASGGGGAGAVGVFPNARVGNCAVPMLLSCSPSVVPGSLAHAPSYGTAAGYGALAHGYRNHEEFSVHSKREAKKLNPRRAARRTPIQKTAILEKVY